MIFLRSIVYFLGLLVSTLFISTLLVLTCWFLPYSQRCAIVNTWGNMNLWMQRVICRLNYQIQGAEHLPHSAAIIMCKHQSAWETIALRGLLAPAQTWVLKRELLWVPFFGWALATVQPIAINRKAKKHALKYIIEQGTQRLKQDNLVIIFPEGTRVAPNERKKYGIGGAMLAAKSGYPIVPIAHNAGVFWKRRGIIKYPGCIQMVIGEPISTQGKKAGEINQEVESWIEARQAEFQLEWDKPLHSPRLSTD